MMESLPGAANLTQTVINTQKQLVNLIYDMKDYKAIKLGLFKKNIENFKLKVAIKEVYQTYLQQCEAKGIKLKLDLDQNLPHTVKSDETRLKQVLTNLVSNALKYTYRGSITIKCDYDSANCMLKVLIVDTGCGILKKD